MIRDCVYCLNWKASFTNVIKDVAYEDYKRNMPTIVPNYKSA